jgi:hypothetical protein
VWWKVQSIVRPQVPGSWAIDAYGDAVEELRHGEHIDVEIHPVDALHLEHHVIGQDIGDGAR